MVVWQALSLAHDPGEPDLLSGCSMCEWLGLTQRVAVPCLQQVIFIPLTEVESQLDKANTTKVNWSQLRVQKP